ncbi:archease [bacterium]|nr:archease [bacterium]
MNQYYSFFDQTSDLGIEVMGPDLESLYRNAALGLTDLITDLKMLKSIKSRIVNVQAEDRELLLREFLAELLYLFHIENFLARDIKIIEISGTNLKAELSGEPIKIGTHRIHREIKSVTYHQLCIKQNESGFKARFVLDI